MHSRISIGMCNQCCFLHQWQGVAGTVTENGVCGITAVCTRGNARTHTSMGKVGCHVRTTIDLLLRDELQPDWRAGDCASTADGKELGVGSCQLVEDR